MDAELLSPHKHMDPTFSQHAGSRNDIPLESLPSQPDQLDSHHYSDPLNSQHIMFYEMPSTNLIPFDSLVTVPLSKGSQEKLSIEANLAQGEAYSRTSPDVSQSLCIIPERCNRPQDNEKFLINQIYTSDDPSSIILDTRHYPTVAKYSLEMGEPEIDLSSEANTGTFHDMNSLAISGVYHASPTTDSEVAMTLASLGDLKHDKLHEIVQTPGPSVDLNSICLRTIEHEATNISSNTEISIGDCHYLAPDKSLAKEKPTLMLRSRRNRVATSKIQQKSIAINDPGKIVKRKRKPTKSNAKLQQTTFRAKDKTQKDSDVDSNDDQETQPQKENLLGELLRASKHCKPASLIPEGVVDDVIPAVGYRIIEMSNLSEMIRVMHRCGRSQQGSVVIQEQASLRSGAVSQLSIICTACQGGAICATSGKTAGGQSDINSRIEQLIKEFNIKQEDIQRMLEILGIFYRPPTIKDSEGGVKKKQKQVKERKHECTICKKKFLGVNYLTSHMKTHNADTHTCPYCQAYFKKRYNLKEHIRKHENQKYECIQCYRSYSDKSTLIAHINMFHEKKAAFTCEYCSKKFSKKSHYNEHLRLHTGEKPYSCEFCGKRYPWHDSVKKHMMTHFAGSKYKCRLCGKLFRWLMGIQNHLLLQHKLKKCDIKAEVISSVVDPLSKMIGDGVNLHLFDNQPLNSKKQSPIKPVGDVNLMAAPQPCLSNTLEDLNPNVDHTTQLLQVPIVENENIFVYQ